MILKIDSNMHHKVQKRIRERWKQDGNGSLSKDKNQVQGPFPFKNSFISRSENSLKGRWKVKLKSWNSLKVKHKRFERFSKPQARSAPSTIWEKKIKMKSLMSNILLNLTQKDSTTKSLKGRW